MLEQFRGLTGDLFGVGVQVSSAVVCGLIIAFVSCWRLVLIMLVILPGVALGGYFEVHAAAGLDSGIRGDRVAANALAVEAVDNVSTVRELGVEDYFISRFEVLISKTVKAKRRKSVTTGIAYGFSELCKCLIWYATYKAGGTFVEQSYCSYTGMFRSTLALIFGASSLGSIPVFAPDLAASKIGTTHVYRLIDKKSNIDPTNLDGEELDKTALGIDVEGVFFEYPRRPEVPVLQGLSLHVSKAKTLAIMGASGHGKSTIIALLERFYGIRKGRICVGEKDISLINVQLLRSRFGYVAQQAELLNRSVFDNIAYGAPHKDGTPISLSDIEDAAREANVHDFIASLPQDYDTVVGPRGDALSGGQRQRVAIARSLIRKPRVLLLDEATSALGSGSEHLVQQALERAASGRTTILVAHRLSTIRNADVIAVVWKGRIVESGTQDVLMRKNGAYEEWCLCRADSASVIRRLIRAAYVLKECSSTVHVDSDCTQS